MTDRGMVATFGNWSSVDEIASKNDIGIQVVIQVGAEARSA